MTLTPDRSLTTSTLIATPVELLKGIDPFYFPAIPKLNANNEVKLQLQSQRSVADRQFKGPIDCARQVIRAQGILGLWSGFTGSLAFRSNFFWMFLSFEVRQRYYIKSARYSN